jgi:integrase
LKNHKGAARNNPLDVPLHESLWPYVEEFLFVHRQHLPGAKECDYVFRRKTARKSIEPDAPVPSCYLSRRIYALTQAYIPGCPGFSMHAFRHLVATEYIKNNPGGYAVAAAVLHDKEETVKECYAWVVPADKLLFWNQYVDAQRERRRREQKEVAEGVR